MCKRPFFSFEEIPPERAKIQGTRNRQAMPVLIHTGPQGRKSLRDLPLRLLARGSAPKPL